MQDGDRIKARWSVSTASCARPTRSCARRRRILLSRSSTARSTGPPCSPRCPRGRAAAIPCAPRRRGSSPPSARPIRPTLIVDERDHRFMRQIGLQGAVRGREVRTTVSNPAVACPLDRVNRQFRAPRPSVVAVGLHVRRDLAGLCLPSLRHRPLRATDRRLAVSRTAHAGFVLDAFEQALADRRPDSGNQPPTNPERFTATCPWRRCSGMGASASEVWLRSCSPT